MRNALICFAVIALALGVTHSFASLPDAPPEMRAVAATTVICRFTDNVAANDMPALTKKLLQQTGGTARHTFTSVFHGFSAHMSLVAANAIAAHNPNIAYCEPNSLLTAGGSPSGASGGKGGNGGKPGQTTPQIVPDGITRVGGPADGTGLVAWVIDSGIDLNHPDLNVDASRGFDAVQSVGKGISTFDDVNGHGTHVAGTLAAIDNDIDVVGVAAGATVVPVRVLAASSFGYADDVIAGIDYVAANASANDVANMSAWGWRHNRALHDAAYALAERIPFIVIAGNDAVDLNSQAAEPAHVEHPHLYTVSAIDRDDVFGDFSNWGYAGDWTTCNAAYPQDPFPCMTVDFAAPGVDVTSLKPGGGLATWYGTSMAAPHVAGVILLLRNAHQRPDNDGFATNDPDGRADPIIHR